MGEFDLIARIAPLLDGAGGDVVIGHGDDAAVVRVGGSEVVVAVDVIVEGVHFRRDLSSWEDVGWKAVAVNVSDLAAMGAIPTAAVIGLCRPAGFREDDVEALYRGLRAACDRWALRLVGGDTVSGPALVVSVTAFGRVDGDGAVTRAGALPGDRLVVVGALGAAAAALAQLARGTTPDPGHLAAHRRPRALPEAGRRLAQHGARAMIDVSDGLGADLGHLCAASGVAATVTASTLPVAPGALEVGGWRLVCGGGEDFALVAALPPERAEEAARAAAHAEGVPAAVVGEIHEPQATAVVLDLPGGGTLDLDRMGYDHFREGDT
ncbi:MAG: thiamine-phosphate kinase [Egibacteraceae bacterium]